MKTGRVVLFFIVAFASVGVPVIVGALLVVGGGGPVFSVDETRLESLRSGGTGHLVGPGGYPLAVRIDERTGNYPGARRADTFDFEDASVGLLEFGDPDEARDSMDAFLEALDTRSTSRTPGRVSYTRADGSEDGRMLLAGRWALWGRASNHDTVDARLAALPFLEQADRSLLCTGALDGGGLWWLLWTIAAYVVLLVISWPRIATWAARVDAEPGADRVSSADLRERLLAVANEPGPVTVREGKRSGELIATWKYADNRWAGPLAAGGIKKLARLRMRIDERRGGVRVQDQLMSVRWDAGAAGGPGGGMAVASVRIGGFRGIVFGASSAGRGAGLIFEDGRLVYDKTYRYQFTTEELKGPIIELIRRCGWHVLPVVSLGR